MKKRLLTILTTCALVSSLIGLAQSSSIRVAGAPLSSGKSDTPVHVDTVGCINTSNGILGGGCNGNLTLGLTSGGVIPINDGKGLDVEVNGVGSNTAGLYARLSGGSGAAIGVSAVRGDAASGYGVAGTATTGIGVYATSASSTALLASNVSSWPAVIAGNTGTGNGVSGVANSGVGVSGSSTSGIGVSGSSSTGYGVQATTNTGTGLYARGGNAVYGLGTATNGVGVWGVANTGTGAIGAYGDSSTGTGVVGHTTSGTGVEAQGNGISTTALKITNGGIKVTGAGDSTSTPVFVQTVHYGAGGNVCWGGSTTIIDNPYANNNPNAIIMVTYASQADGRYSFATFYNASIYVPYGCPKNHWLITNTYEDGTGGGGSTLWDGSQFNVMVITP